MASVQCLLPRSAPQRKVTDIRGGKYKPINLQRLESKSALRRKDAEKFMCRAGKGRKHSVMETGTLGGERLALQLAARLAELRSDDPGDDDNADDDPTSWLYVHAILLGYTKFD